MLDLECFTYLNRALESPLSPIVILASNRGHTVVKGTTALQSSHGIPPDLLPRLLIIPTHPYTAQEIRAIISIRARLEFAQPTAPTLSESTAQLKVQGSLAEDALEELTKQGSEVSLRYALQLLAPSGILARARGSEGGVVSGQDVKEATELFWDAGRSASGFGEAGFIS
jgi:RuvB-like protein 1